MLLARIRPVHATMTTTLTPLVRTRSRSASPSTPPDEPAAKRLRTSQRPTLPYRDGLHLAPMVRIGTLPTRLLSLEHGASLVWGPEIVDRAIIGATRVVDPQTGVVRFVKGDHKAVFECHPLEKSRLIFQLGSSDPRLAVEAIRLVEGDVAGVGLNCGCPKPFSIKGGMGAALLSEPDKLCSILDALCDNFDLPIDCKIRLLPSEQDTLDLVAKIVATPISNLTVHCRTKDMRSSEPALLERLRLIVDKVHEWRPDLPVVANGDCIGVANAADIRARTGVSSIMIARGAEANPTCFAAEPLAAETLLKRYVLLAQATGNPVANSKYVLGTLDLAQLDGGKRRRGELKDSMNKSKSTEDLAKAVGLEDDDEWRRVSKGELDLAGLVPNWLARSRTFGAEAK